VVTAHKGDLWLRLETQGKAAHGATPHLGRNAVREMARVVEALETDYQDLLSRRRHRLLGFPTISVGKIQGGTQANIVPDRCSIEVDRRTLPGESERSVTSELKSFLRTAGCRAQLSRTKGVDCPPLETPQTQPWVRRFLTSTGQRTGAGVDFFCDAALLDRGGIPCVVFGPGEIAQAHTADEWISLSQLDRGTAMLTRFLRSLP
jgi:acetylornithine deacetylase